MMSPVLRRGASAPKPPRTPDAMMTLTEHLGELRVRIIRSALAITLGAIIIIAFYDHVLDFLTHPYIEICKQHSEDFCGFDANDPNAHALFIFDPIDGLATRLKVASYGGLVFVDDTPDTLAEAMAVLEAGLTRWFEEQGVIIE